MLEFVALRDIQSGEEVLIDYGKEWQEAWDEHVKNWKPSFPEHDFNNLTHWTKQTDTPNGEKGYIRGEVLNGDQETPIKTMSEQMNDPYPHSVQVMCYTNANDIEPYLFVPSVTPYFARDWSVEVDFGEHRDDHLHLCNVTERYDREIDLEDDGEEEDEAPDDHEFFYSVELWAEKKVDEVPFIERHEISDVPRKAIHFGNRDFTSDVYLKQAFRHEMILPDDIFPQAWMNIMEKQETA